MKRIDHELWINISACGYKFHLIYQIVNLTWGCPKDELLIDIQGVFDYSFTRLKAIHSRHKEWIAQYYFSFLYTGGIAYNDDLMWIALKENP